jgi:hypothetical protein
LCAVVPGHHKHGSTTRVGNFYRPICEMFSIGSSVIRVPDAPASRCAPRLAVWTDIGHQTVHISSKVL